MSVNFNGFESKLHTLIGCGPQGSWAGQEYYLVASDNSANCVDLEDRFKFCGDLTILELVMLGSILTEYSWMEHAPLDLEVEQRFLPAQRLETQVNLDCISKWTTDNIM